MKFFSQGSIHVGSFRGIQTSTVTNTELFLHNNLNTTVKWQFLLQENLVLGDYHELEDMWLDVETLPVRSFSNVKSLVVEGCEFLTNTVLPSHLLPFLRKLEELEVKNCNSVEAIFDVKDTPTHYTAMGPTSPLHLRLKKVTLKKLPKLKHVWNEDPQGSITSLPFLEVVSVEECENLQSLGLEHSWAVPFTQSLKKIDVVKCKCLTNLVPSTVSFSHLKSLKVDNCEGLKYLFTSSTAKSLHLLKYIVVKDCESLQEIVFEEAVEELSHDKGEIIFEQLKILYLHSLPSLGRFYNGTCALELPSLERLSIIKCSRMLTFSEGTLIANKLSQVKFEEHADDVPLKVDLNSIIRNVFEAPEHFVFGDNHELEEMWLGDVPVPEWSFINLKSLTVEGCEFLSKAILPSHLLPFLRKLEELKVLKCNFVEAIFDVQDTKMGPAARLKLGLKKLILKELPNLKQVWNEDPQPQGNITLPFLEEVSAVGCDSIKSLFPASVVKGIKTLFVKNCEGLVEIVAKDDGATEGAIEKLIIFSSLNSLTLWSLPNLKCFYPGMHNQEWPILTVLNVSKCPKLKVFVTDFQNCPDKHPEGQDILPTDQQALISADKVIPHLEELSLNKEDVRMILQGQVHVVLLKLKYLKLQFFNDELDVFPYVFLSKVPLPRIERLEVGDSSLKEIFPSERPDVDDTKILSQLKGLELNSLSMLKSIGLEHFWIAPFTERLKTLNVRSCKCLTNLVPSTVSFSHLTELIIQYCDGLEYLFTSSTAKSLGALEKMEIANCKSLKKVVEDEPAEEESSLKNNVEDEQEKDEPDQDDEPDEDEMIFEKLEILSLRSLPRLESFYTGSSTLKFPSLVKVWFTECDNMKMFCHGDVTVPKNLEGEVDGVHWSGVINTAINLS